MKRVGGFTVVELLLVVAIIGVLSAMVFPVFTRARESALSAQCFSNVRQVAMAMRMYLSDYGAFPPSEHREEVYDFFDGSGPCQNNNAISQANPYLQWPVLLDRYLRNRSVWSCPNAKLAGQADFIMSNPDWLQELKDHPSEWGQNGLGPVCTHMTFPSGWGGTVTDSIYQQQSAIGAPGSFTQSIGAARFNLDDRRVSSLNNPSRVITVADCTFALDALSIATIAYPDICCAECSGIVYFVWGGWPNPNGCPDGTYCPECPPQHAMLDWAQNTSLQRLSTRHSGGSNVGFADGHVAWYWASMLIRLSDARYFQEVGWYCRSSSLKGYQTQCGTPPAGMVFLHREPTKYDGSQ